VALQVRNRLKIHATVNNARIVTELEDEYDGGFAKWVWDNLASMPDKERYLQQHLKSYMRSDFQTKAVDR